MKKLLILLFGFCLAFSQEQIALKIFYVDPQDEKCNTFKSQIASIIDNRFLKSQNILFQTIQIPKNSPSLASHYNFQKDCNAVISFSKDDKEMAFETLSLDWIVNYYSRRNMIFADTSRVIPHSFLAGVWGFIFQHTNYLYGFFLCFSLFCGIISAFSIQNELDPPTLPNSIPKVIFSIAVGCVFSLGSSFYSVQRTNIGEATPLYFSAIILLFAQIFATSRDFSNESLYKTIKNLCTLCLPSTFFAICVFSLKLDFFMVMLYAIGFLTTIFLLSRFEISWYLQNTITKVASIPFAILSFYLFYIFGCKSPNTTLGVIFVASILYTSLLYVSIKKLP